MVLLLQMRTSAVACNHQRMGNMTLTISCQTANSVVGFMYLFSVVLSFLHTYFYIPFLFHTHINTRSLSSLFVVSYFFSLCVFNHSFVCISVLDVVLLRNKVFSAITYIGNGWKHFNSLTNRCCVFFFGKWLMCNFFIELQWMS